MTALGMRLLVVSATGALITLGSCGADAPLASPTEPAAAAMCASPQPGWIWCDDFEVDRKASYFEYDSAGGSFVRVVGVGVGGSVGMRVHFAAGQVNAGSLKVAFGKMPSSSFRPVDAGSAAYRDIYWRTWMKNQAGWTGGGGDKLSRATSLVAANWTQAMMAHVWSGSDARATYLILDPASGTDAAGVLRTTQFNDIANFRWLGQGASSTPVFDAAHVGQWHCIEAHARLNDAGSSNGVNELWIDGALEAQRTGLNFVGAFSTYGINAVFFENYWNAGSPVAQERYIDGLVVSTQRIGC